MFRKITDVGYGFFSRASTSLPSTASVDNLCEEEEMPSTMECQNREDANRIAYMVHDSVANRRDLMSSREVSVDLSQPPTKAAEENRYPDAKSKRLLIAANRLNGCNFFQKACTWFHNIADKIRMTHLLRHSPWMTRGAEYWGFRTGLILFDGTNVGKLNWYKCSVENVIWCSADIADALEPDVGGAIPMPQVEKMILDSEAYLSQCDPLKFDGFKISDLLDSWPKMHDVKGAVLEPDEKSPEPEERCEEERCEAADTSISTRNDVDTLNNEESTKDMYEMMMEEVKIKSAFTIYDYDLWMTNSRLGSRSDSIGFQEYLILRSQTPRSGHEVRRETLHQMPMTYEPPIEPVKLLLNAWLAILVADRTIDHRLKQVDEGDILPTLTPMASRMVLLIKYALMLCESEKSSDYYYEEDFTSLRRQLDLPPAPEPIMSQTSHEVTSVKRKYRQEGYCLYVQRPQQLGKESVGSGNKRSREDPEGDETGKEKRRPPITSSGTNLEADSGSVVNMQSVSQDESGLQQDSTGIRRQSDQGHQSANADTTKSRSSGFGSFDSDVGKSRSTLESSSPDTPQDLDGRSTKGSPASPLKGKGAEGDFSTLLQINLDMPAIKAEAMEEDREVKRKRRLPSDAQSELASFKLLNKHILNDIDEFIANMQESQASDYYKLDYRGIPNLDDAFEQLLVAQVPFLQQLRQCIVKAFEVKVAQVGQRKAMGWLRSHIRHEYDDECDKIELAWRQKSMEIWQSLPWI